MLRLVLLGIFGRLIRIAESLRVGTLFKGAVNVLRKGGNGTPGAQGGNGGGVAIRLKASETQLDLSSVIC